MNPHVQEQSPKAKRNVVAKEKRDHKKLVHKIQKLREARAIITVATLDDWTTPDGKHPDAPSYKAIAKMLGLDDEARELADELWNQSNGPDEGKETEENALERCNSLLEMALEDL